eukprot:Opistho-2@67403
MAARQVARKVFDWAGVSSRIPAELRPTVGDLRTRYDQLWGRLDSLPKTEPIDWEYYSVALAPAKKTVDEFRKQVEAIQLPSFGDVQAKNADEIAKAEKENQLRVQAVIKDANDRVAALKEKLKVIESMKAVDELTADDQLAAHPEWAKQIQADWDRYMFFETDTLKKSAEKK